MTFRVPEELETRLNAAIASANNYTLEEPYTLGSYIRKCIEEKLSHLERSTSKKRAKVRRQNAADMAEINAEFLGTVTNQHIATTNEKEGS